MTDFIFLGSRITTDGDCSHEIKRGLLLGRKTMTNLDSLLKIRAVTLPSWSYGFSSNHVWMWEFSHKEGWVPKNGCFQSVVLEKTLECLLDYKEIKSMNPEGNQPWILIEKIDAETVAPILWPPVVKSRIIGKDPDAGKDWRQKRRQRQRIKSLDSITDRMNVSLRKLWKIVEDIGAWHAAVHGVIKHWTWIIGRTATAAKVWPSL